MKKEKFVCRKMSSRMKYKNRKLRTRRRHRALIIILTLSILSSMLFTEILARPRLEAWLFPNKPTTRVVKEKQQQQQDAFINSFMAPTVNENLLNKVKKSLHNKPNSLKKWPGLQNLVLALDYDDSESSNEYLKSLIFGNLRELVSAKPNNYNNDMRYDNRPANQLNFKERSIKKNLQYMSPCHFKICNMGRKRYARNIQRY